MCRASRCADRVANDGVTVKMNFEGRRPGLRIGPVAGVKRHVERKSKSQVRSGQSNKVKSSFLEDLEDSSIFSPATFFIDHTSCTRDCFPNNRAFLAYDFASERVRVLSPSDHLGRAVFERSTL